MSEATELQIQINEIAIATIDTILTSGHVQRPEDKIKLIKYIVGAALGKKDHE
jgi:hypothetical protein